VDMTRRGFLGLAAAVAGTAGAAASPGAQAATRTWLVPRYGTFSALTDTSLGGDPAVARNAFGLGTTWFSVIYHGEGTDALSPIPPGYAGVAVLKFAAYENGSDGLLDAISDGLPSWVQAVQYDSESWAFTPPIEKGAWLHNPQVGVSYAELFCRKAHELGFPVVLTPGLDLCNNKPNPAYPGAAPQYPVSSGERNYEAYVRYRLASAARWLQPGDVYEFQSQALETDTALYQSVTTHVEAQVREVSEGVTFLAGIGRTEANWDHATAAQLTAAARSVASVAAGYWPNVDEDAARVQAMIRFLKNLGY
jgi:hypothetical protein